MVAPPSAYVQRDQPAGVPPLALTGERTLPDVPAENYWFRRHLVVYEWAAARLAGARVVDMACGEGYGLPVLARTAAAVTGVERDPETHRHAALRYAWAGPGSEPRPDGPGDPAAARTAGVGRGGAVDRGRSRSRSRSPDGAPIDVVRADVHEHRQPCEAIVHLQTIEHVADPDALLAHFRSLLPADGRLVVSTPNVRTLAGGAAHSGNPFHVREYDATAYRALLERTFGHVELHGVHHARRLRLHQWALDHAAWDRVHAATRLTKPFYDRFVPALTTRDFAVRDADAAPLERALDLLAVCRP